MNSNTKAHGGAGAADDGIPTAAAYRVREADINTATCVGRRIIEMDKRWKPAVFRENQCGKPTLHGSDMCAVCSRRLEKFATNGLKANGDSWMWAGRITEEPPGWIHMLGTEWAAIKKPKWVGAAAEEGSVSVSDDETTVSVVTHSGKDLRLIAGTIYLIKGGNVYNYNEITEKAGDYKGRLTGDGEIDADAPEIVKISRAKAEAASLRAALVRAEAEIAALRARAESAEGKLAIIRATLSA